MRAAAKLLIAIALLAPACTSKSKEANQEAKARIWGRDEPPPEVEAKAAEQLDPTVLDADPAVRDRVLQMRFDEVVARLGIVEYHGLAKIEVERGKQRLVVIEDSIIRQGLHGSFQVIQRDEKGAELRQGIWNNGVFYLSNAGGKMRVEGMTKDRHLILRDEAWQPLRVFSGYFGPRFGLRKAGTGQVAGRSAIKYELVLLDGPEKIESTSGDAAKKPRSLDGTLLIDTERGVPLKGELNGTLEVPPLEGAEGSEAGRITVSLQFELKTIEGEEIKPKSFIPTIERHPVDLAPLAFLDGGIRTSTVIGGPKKTRPKNPPPGATKTATTPKP